MHSLMLCVFVILVVVMRAEVIDMGTGEAIENEWIQIGSVSVGTATWVTVEPSFDGFVDPVVFLRFYRKYIIIVKR